MSSTRRKVPLWYAAIAVSLPMAGASAQTTTATSTTDKVPTSFVWSIVANSATTMPGDTRTFNSFNQPSVNSTGLVVLRGRSKAGQNGGEPLRGLYSRQMGGVPGALTVVFDTKTPVPQPNNVDYSGKPGTFTEFPAFPRIGVLNKSIATRGQSKPVWTYNIDPETTTQVGTAGVFALRSGAPVSVATQLGAVPGFEYFSVPEASVPGTKFDQFPGAPAVAHANAMAFKGNYTDGGVAKTGIFFRLVNPRVATSKVELIANSDSLIPGQSVTKFGSTAPPSASDEYVVFLGLDNEESPTLGGIYRAPLASKPALTTLVRIGDPVPGEAAGETFNRLGEALSYDGRYLAFWGAWGTATSPKTLTCPTDGQKDVVAYCNTTYPTGMSVEVPVKQGFFVFDTKAGLLYPVVKTGGDYADFLYWTFSGRPPGASDSESEDFEAPRWRSAAFVATYGPKNTAQVAFKARKSTGTDGIYLTTAPASTSVISTVIENGMDGSVVDPKAAGVPVIAVGIERDSLRNGWLAIAVSMANADTGWAGVYQTRTAR